LTVLGRRRDWHRQGANGLDRGLTNIYFVVFPDGVDSCDTATESVTAVAPLSLGRVTLDKHRGTATLSGSTLRSGALQLSGSQIKPLSTSTANFASSGLTVKATGKAATTLAAKGSVKVTAVVSLTPTGGTKYTTSKAITLKKN